jgi:predicted transcriptional regulator
MPSKYEVASDETVPIARSIIAKALIKRYKMRELEVAEYLGVAQAAISKYITEKHSEKLAESTERVEETLRNQQKLIDEYIKRIAEGKKEYVNICICTICAVANDFRCTFSHACGFGGEF